MPYQDKWVNGKVIERGTRECAKRYEVIRDFCITLPPKFTVCDIGANWCYFDFRLLQDFPGCRIVAFEFRASKAVRDLAKQNKADRLVLLDHKLQLPEIAVLAEACRFDVVLALSVVHHLSEPIDDWMDAFLRLGKYVIAEFAGKDSRREAATATPSRHQGQWLGYGDSHLVNGFQRPILAFGVGARVRVEG